MSGGQPSVRIRVSETTADIERRRLSAFRTTRRRSHESLHGNRTHGTGREDRTLLSLRVRQVSSPDDGPRGNEDLALAPEEGLEPSPQRFKVADPFLWTTPERSLWTESNCLGSLVGTSGPPRRSAASLPQGESALRADRRAQRTPSPVGLFHTDGAEALIGERLHGMQKVAGAIPVSSTASNADEDYITIMVLR